MALLTFDVNYNHLFFFLIFVVYLIRELIKQKVDEFIGSNNEACEYKISNKAIIRLFNIYIYAISNLFAFFFFCIIKIRTKKQKRFLSGIVAYKKSNIQLINSGSPIRKSILFKRTFYVSLFDFLAQFIVFFIYLVAVKDDSEAITRYKLDCFNTIEILSRYILSRILLKSFFYRHHYLALGVNLFCLIILFIFIDCEKFKGNPVSNFIFIISRIVSITLFSLEDVEGKISMTKDFLSPYSLLIFKGCYEIIMLIIITIPFIYIDFGNGNVFSKMNVFINGGLKFLLTFLLMIANFVYNTFIWIIIDKFSPNDLAMVSFIEGMTYKILILIKRGDLNMETSQIILSIIIYIILAIGICIYSEIIIINKYGLDEYTKKKIGLKGEEDTKQTRLSYDYDCGGSSCLNELEMDNKFEKSSTKDMEKVGKKLINPIKKENKSRAKTILQTINIMYCDQPYD